ncbi:DUF748 domain-containing protein [Runella slithyformis]|uniref:DUF748 domain-containing protein n=1 Tax=Runella slithyformis (strain ATCC 29530 / DSM 19594 / LMG 11500 / NCIMB 11436 / LSU 4) TaxID=761193 RepID=A0A7U3ZIM0_RUNSL|nr:DUF748 domain-containing protein [Runella slithyformis]AEI47885.1 hypothetical protein Runsl_1459 [Runella slithyformis DSM 19594]
MALGNPFRNKKFRIFSIVIGVLVLIRLLLPYILLHYANKSLATMSDYYGHIEDIDLSIYRGAYQINDMYLNRLDEKSNKQTEFFKTRNIDLAIEWKPLFKGTVVGQLMFDSPTLIFTKNKTELDDVQKDTNDFRKLLKDFMPLKVNKFEIRNGSIHYIDPNSTPKLDIFLTDSYVLAQNLTNADEAANKLPATVNARANVYTGTMVLNMKLNPLADDPTFDLNAEIKNSNLVLLNDFFKAYGHFDINKGNFGLYTEFAANKGKFKGYVKPIIKDLDVLGPEDRKDSFFQKVWEALAGGVSKVLENPKKDQVATKVAIEGSFENPRTRTIDAVFELLRNAFIRALVPSVDNQISLNSLKEVESEDKRNFFQKLFNKKDKEKDKK